jgi:hypothetical protein
VKSEIRNEAAKRSRPPGWLPLSVFVALALILWSTAGTSGLFAVMLVAAIVSEYRRNAYRIRTQKDL